MTRKFLLVLILAFALVPAAVFAEGESPDPPVVDAVHNTLIEDNEGNAAWRADDGFAWEFYGVYMRYPDEWELSADGTKYNFVGDLSDADPDDPAADPVIGIIGYNGEATELILPETINGYAVVEYDASRYGEMLGDGYADGEREAADRITSIYIPACIVDGYISGVDGGTFPNLKTFAVDPASECYYAENGILYRCGAMYDGSDDDYLEAYPPAKAGTSFVVSSKRMMMPYSDYTFRNAKYLKEITIPANQKFFDLGAIDGSAIETVLFLGDNVDYMGSLSPALKKKLVFQSDLDALAAQQAAAKAAASAKLDTKIKKAKAAKSKLTVKALKGKRASVKWKKVKGVTGYRIYRATKKSGKYKLVRKSACNSHFTWTNTGLKKGKKYYYKVRPYTVINGKTYWGKYSAIVSIKARK